MLNLDTFIADCLAAVRADPTHRAAHEVMSRAFSDPSQVLAAVGEPAAGGFSAIYRSPELTILNVIWKPGFTIHPHNHEMWALIGVYTGREDNIFWRRLKDDAPHPAGKGRIEAAGAKALSTGDVVPLGKDIIHSVTNPIDRFSGAIHIYGGDFFGVPRSEWDPGALTERPYDVEKTRALFGA
jgi:predicted metal-dependent enzyme (double-stranded beta helix superfamily)